MTGCKGQIGIPLIKALVKECGADNVIASDLNSQKYQAPCRFETLDILDQKRFESIVKENKVDYIVHLGAIISAIGEKYLWYIN